MTQKRFDPVIQTHTFPLEDVSTALRYARDRIDDAIKVVVKMNHRCRRGGQASFRRTDAPGLHDACSV
jgi:hypothetical protein